MSWLEGIAITYHRSFLASRMQSSFKVFASTSKGFVCTSQGFVRPSKAFGWKKDRARQTTGVPFVNQYAAIRLPLVVLLIGSPHRLRLWISCFRIVCAILIEVEGVLLGIVPIFAYADTCGIHDSLALQLAYDRLRRDILFLFHLYLLYYLLETSFS